MGPASIGAVMDLTSPSPDELQASALDELRRRRDELELEEAAVSYTRRLVQGRLDIVSAEIRRREQGASPAQLAEIIESLPTSLSGGTQGGGVPRPIVEVPPSERVAQLVGEFDVALPPERFAELPHIDEPELKSIAASLLEAERGVSARRRQLHEVIDVLQGEIIRRYQTGEATVDSLFT